MKTETIFIQTQNVNSWFWLHSARRIGYVECLYLNESNHDLCLSFTKHYQIDDCCCEDSSVLLFEENRSIFWFVKLFFSISCCQKNHWINEKSNWFPPFSIFFCYFLFLDSISVWWQPRKSLQYGYNCEDCDDQTIRRSKARHKWPEKKSEITNQTRFQSPIFQRRNLHFSGESLPRRKLHREFYSMYSRFEWRRNHRFDTRCRRRWSILLQRSCWAHCSHLRCQRCIEVVGRPKWHSVNARRFQLDSPQ